MDINIDLRKEKRDHANVYANIKKVLNYTMIIIVCLIFIGPFAWMFLTSFKSLGETLLFPPTIIPKEWHPENYIKAWQSGPFLRYLINSVIVTVSIIVLQCLTIIPAAYAFARYEFKGKNFLFFIVMLTMMIPAQLIFLPLFLMMSKMSLINTYLSLILPFASSAFGIFLLRQRFMQIPDELIESAKLDNASDVTILYKIMLPQAKSTLVTFILFSFISNWNDYFWPLVMTTKDTVRTLPLGVSMLKSTMDGISWNVLMAGNMILVVPIILIFLLAQKRIIDAFVYTGIK